MRATKRLSVSPQTMPRTPPSGLERAVRRPRRIASAMGVGTTALARRQAASKSREESDSSSRSARRWSLVPPDGPGAAPRRADRTLDRNRDSSNRNGGGQNPAVLANWLARFRRPALAKWFQYGSKIQQHWKMWSQKHTRENTRNKLEFDAKSEL